MPNGPTEAARALPVSLSFAWIPRRWDSLARARGQCAPGSGRTEDLATTETRPTVVAATRRRP